MIASLALVAANLVAVGLVERLPLSGPLWLGTGVLSGLLILSPRRRWVVFMVIFAVSAVIFSGVAGESWLAIVCRVAISLGEAGLVARALHADRAWVDGVGDRTAVWARFFLIAVIVAPAVAGVARALVLMLEQGASFMPAHRGAYVAHALATGVMVPLMLRLRRGRPPPRVRRAITMNDELYRSIAVDSGAMILVSDEQGRNEYASPATCEFLGVTAAELAGHGWQRTIWIEDEPVVSAALERLRSGEQEAVCVVRLRAKDGELRWVEARCRRSRPMKAAARGLVIWTARDVTAEKLRNEALEAEKEALEAMVGTDPLTGLANRRRFDDLRRREWQRACRDGTPISMLVVDVDHFKKYNDTYGHAAGDRCLVAIAGALAACMRRPADFCARHGGEEFVALLPATDAVGAQHVAEAIRAAVEQLEAPDGRVTVSIGAATCMRTQSSNIDWLFDEADRRLYRAKAGGRNRVV